MNLARVRAYGYPGRRQTRWIKGRHELTTEEVRAGTRFEDAVARTAWPIELHDRADGYVWEKFGPNHVHYVPLRAMTPLGADNLVAACRCVDGDAAALSSVRVMGPCAAMGAAAAHALDLAAQAQVHVPALRSASPGASRRADAPDGCALGVQRSARTLRKASRMSAAVEKRSTLAGAHALMRNSARPGLRSKRIVLGSVTGTSAVGLAFGYGWRLLQRSR